MSVSAWTVKDYVGRLSLELVFCSLAARAVLIWEKNFCRDLTYRITLHELLQTRACHFPSIVANLTVAQTLP